MTARGAEASAVERIDVTGDCRHVIVYYDPKGWAAVPANNGANGPQWQWGEEILIGFTLGTFMKRKTSHQVDYDHPPPARRWACGARRVAGNDD